MICLSSYKSSPCIWFNYGQLCTSKAGLIGYNTSLALPQIDRFIPFYLSLDRALLVEYGLSDIKNSFAAMWSAIEDR